MQAKSVLYAAVGAPVIVARKVGDQVSTLKGRLSEEKAGYTESANKTLDEWAAEGEKVVSGIREGKVVEEISQKVDLDQAKEQVGKLRDQLEDMLATWRQSFRPETADETKSDDKADKPGTSKPATKSTSGKPTAKTTAGKAAGKASAAKTTKSSSAAKTNTAKETASKAKSSS
jgi:hypothetical protein